MRYEISINEVHKYRVEENGGQLLVNGEAVFPDIAETGEGLFHVLIGNRSYNAELVDFDRETKSGHLKINGNSYAFSARDQYDELLEKLGMAGAVSQKVNDLKAPMPGLVLKTLVNPGQEVKKGESLLVLEAMKMENIIKSPGDGTVLSLLVKPGDAVEKNEVLIKFES